MTRDEIIDRMSVELEPEDLAKAICHDGFDQFAALFARQDAPVEELTELDVVFAWEFFRDGWHERGVSKWERV